MKPYLIALIFTSLFSCNKSEDYFQESAMDILIVNAEGSDLLYPNVENGIVEEDIEVSYWIENEKIKQEMSETYTVQVVGVDTYAIRLSLNSTFDSNNHSVTYLSVRGIEEKVEVEYRTFENSANFGLGKCWVNDSLVWEFSDGLDGCSATLIR